MPSPAEVRALYRAFLKEGKKFPNYNIREYVERKVKMEFHEHMKDSQAALEQLWAKAKEDFGVVHRQATVYHMYARKEKSIMDLPLAVKSK